MLCSPCKVPTHVLPVNRGKPQFLDLATPKREWLNLKSGRSLGSGHVAPYKGGPGLYAATPETGLAAAQDF